MLFVQYNTVQDPTIRDTKDIWEIRNELTEEQKQTILNMAKFLKDSNK